MPTVDQFSSFVKGPESPAIDLDDVVPSDTVDQANVLRQIYVGTTGDVTVVTTKDSVRFYKAVPQGTHIGPFRVKRVNATGTTALDMIGSV